MSERVRRQVYLLSAQDLTDYAVWEFCSDEEDAEGHDEATVRPAVATELASNSPGEFVVAADCGLADGSTMPAYLYTGGADDLGCVQPNFLTSDGQVNCWLGALQFIPDVKSTLESSYRSIGKNREAVFPATFESRVNVGGSRLRVVVQGFMGLDAQRRAVVVG